MTKIITKSETARNARLFAAWYQSIPLMLNYWIGGNNKLVKGIMQNVPMPVLQAEWLKGCQARLVAERIASNCPAFKSKECQRRMMT